MAAAAAQATDARLGGRHDGPEVIGTFPLYF
jgi:hypothetical protein